MLPVPATRSNWRRKASSGPAANWSTTRLPARQCEDSSTTSSGFRATFGTHVPAFGYSSVVTTEPIEGIPYDYQLHAGQHDVARVALEHAKTLGVEVLF